MSIMCSALTATGLVTFDIGVQPNGKAIYGVSWWNGEQWKYAKYKSFKEARKTYRMISRMS